MVATVEPTRGLDAPPAGAVLMLTLDERLSVETDGGHVVEGECLGLCAETAFAVEGPVLFLRDEIGLLIGIPEPDIRAVRFISRALRSHSGAAGLGGETIRPDHPH